MDLEKEDRWIDSKHAVLWAWMILEKVCHKNEHQWYALAVKIGVARSDTNRSKKGYLASIFWSNGYDTLYAKSMRTHVNNKSSHSRATARNVINYEPFRAICSRCHAHGYWFASTTVSEDITFSIPSKAIEVCPLVSAFVLDESECPEIMHI